MKLRNKKTGEIIDFDSITDLCFGNKIQLQATDRYNKPIYIYNSLAELNEEWEDYEEPKPWWYIDITLVVKQGELFLSNHVEQFKTVGNYFETREEAEKAVEKLKAWKRLKDKGFRFTGWNGTMTGRGIEYEAGKYYAEWVDDMNLIFEGEE